jgi:hypothetical protein
MGAEESRLSLRALAQRLDTLERENAELRSKVATLEGSGTRRHADAERASESSEADLEGRVSRKWLLSKAGAAAAGLAVAGALTQRDIREAKAAAPETFISNVAGTPGVTGKNTFGGVGVRGEGLYGVEGETSGATGQGVHGINSSAGDGVLGDSQGGNAIHGRSFGPTGAGVFGEHFGNGYGGQFEGGKAPLRLIPGSTPGRPKDGLGHQKGEIYLDSAGALFVCVKRGKPGRWRKVTTTTA